MRRFLAVAILAVGGCGGSGDDGSGAIMGAWTTPVGASCALAFAFTQPSGYSRGALCSLSSGGLGLQEETGDFGVTPGRINFEARRSTCTGVQTPYYLEYQLVDSNHLRLTGASDVVVLARADSGGTAAATFGCFAGTTFTPAPLAPVP